LQGDTYVGQVSFDVVTPVSFPLKQHFAIEMLPELARALLQTQIDVFDDFWIGLDCLLGL
jgi:hypothetical protein